MVRSSKRAKATAAPTAPDGAELGSVSAQPPPFIPFQTGPSLERIPDDVLHEILSHLPFLEDNYDEFALVRVPILRVLSRTSRLLRSRCLAMAWRSVELCGTSIPKWNGVFFKVIGEATLSSIRLLTESPHLVPLVQTVSVYLTRYHSSEIVPAFASCLTMLPNLTTIQVVHAHSQMTTAIKTAFEGKRFPSVRRISLPPSAHEIIRSCPNIEQVTCTEGNGSTIIGSLVKGNCQQVRVLKGIDAPVTRLVKLLPNLKHISVALGADMTRLASFSLLDTIEIVVHHRTKLKRPLTEIASSDIEKASKILKENMSQANKTVIVTKWHEAWTPAKFEFDVNIGFMIREAIKV